MRIKFLGTAAAEGWPALFCECLACEKARARGGKNIRSRSSALINSDFLIDFPPDSYMHSILNGFRFSEVKYLFITHSHQDHFYPEDLAMRAYPFAHFQHERILSIFGNVNVIAKINEYRLNGARTRIEARVVRPFEKIRVSDYEVLALKADHQPGEECLFYLVKNNGKAILWGTDTGYFPEDTWRALEKERLDVVILDATSGPHSTPSYHMGIPEILRVKEIMLKEGIANESTIFIATHFSHNGGLLHEELEKLLKPHNIVPAYDGFEVNV